MSKIVFLTLAPIIYILLGDGSEPAQSLSCNTETELTCSSETDYCALEIGACGTTNVTGVCQTKPEVCTDDYTPVCGCDGQTYSNECYANSQGVNILSNSACEVSEPIEETCSADGSQSCSSSNDFCSWDANASCGTMGTLGVCELKPEVCTDDYTPVCGCDGQTYSNECYANSAGVSVIANGECGIIAF